MGLRGTTNLREGPQPTETNWCPGRSHGLHFPHCLDPIKIQFDRNYAEAILYEVKLIGGKGKEYIWN